MHGNVNEWCQDWYHGSYDGAPTNGRAWESAGPYKQVHVIRGGSWGNSADKCRSAFRFFGSVSLVGSQGFRIVAVRAVNN